MSPFERMQSLDQKSTAVSCILPVYNEETIILSFLLELQATLLQLTNHFEIIVVDDGSSDQTVTNLLNAVTTIPQLKILCLSRNFGKEIALTAGLEHCKGDVAILMDADFQHPLNLLPIFLHEWANDHDMVYGIRRDRRAESLVKRNAARIFYWLMKKITKIEIPNNAGDFRLLDQKIVAALKEFPERTRFMKGLYAWVGYKKKGILYEVQERAAGKSTWRLGKLTELAITGITSFSDVPLRVWGFIGFVISLLSLMYAVYMVTSTLLFGTNLPGFPTLVVSVVFLGGIQLLSVGILGEYIARIFTEVKQRPKYLLQFKVGFDE